MEGRRKRGIVGGGRFYKGKSHLAFRRKMWVWFGLRGIWALGYLIFEASYEIDSTFLSPPSTLVVEGIYLGPVRL